MQFNNKLMKNKKVLWEGDELPNGNTYELIDNIYNYSTLLFFCQWGIRFEAPIVSGETNIFGGTMYPTGAGLMATAGINSTSVNNGDSIKITYLRQLTHTPNGNHGSFEAPKLLQIIGKK